MNYIKALNFSDIEYSHVYRTLKKAAPLIKNIDYEICSESINPKYTLISNKDFIFPELSLDESIEKGIKFVKQYDNVILYDATDSTSLQGIVEILDNCDNIKCLVKHQILDREEYSKPAPFGRWFFRGLGFDDLCSWSYNISEELYNKIFLSGLNIFYWLAPVPQFPDKTPTNYYVTPNIDKYIDIFNICGLIQKEKSRFGYNDALPYNKHRQNCIDSIDRLNYNIAKNRVQHSEYIDKLRKSKLSFSPYGMGELCLRDVESWFCGTALVKPDISLVKTIPNIWNDPNRVTTWTCKPDLSDLKEQVDYLLQNEIIGESLILNAFESIDENYGPEILEQWEKILK